MHRLPILLSCLALLASAEAAFAQSATTQAVVKIENYALILTKTNDLDFGSITPSVNNNGYVSMLPNGMFDVQGGIAAHNPAGSNPARYTLTGVPSAPVSIMLPGSTVSLSNGTQSLLLGDFAAEGGATQQLGTDGTLIFRVGATVFIQALQRPGVYSGSFDVTVAYN